MKTAAASILVSGALFLAPHATSAEFATPGGPEPVNIAEGSAFLKKDAYDL